MSTRICKLEDCDNEISSDSSVRKEYCCDAHGSLFRLRNKRLRDKEKSDIKPYIITGCVCPIDGKVFPVTMFKKRGRPKKYDCDGCKEISRQLNLLSKEEK